MADLHAQPIQPLLFDPDHIAPTTSRLDFSYHADFLTENRPQLNNYIRHAQIGQGEHGSVYLCNRIDPTLPIGHPNRRMPAMKSVKRVSAKADKLQKLQRTELPKSNHTTVTDKIRTKERQIKREIAIMKKLRHPHVVRLYEIIDDRLREKIYIVMEHLGGGEIKWHNQFHGPVLTVAQSRRILRDALLGLEYLHRQGIIHRDIKPANLFWTDDRRQVKIGDFGVSHFCYAQQLGDAAEANGKAPPRDPLFQNDVDLTRHAGTPSFLAPELVYEYTYDARTKRFIYVDEPVKETNEEKDGEEGKNDDKDKANDPGPSRPPKPKVTPAIDVWALGVTLYCLLFGNTPFLGYTEGQQRGNEYRLYNMICNADWPAPPTMGWDLIPSGGRHPIGDSEGADVIRLLDLFLQKDVSERITLEQVMDYPWVVRDLADINRWRQRNLHVVQEAPIHVSTVETSDAMSTVHFRWRWGSRLARHVSSLFRGVRPINIGRSTRPEADDGIGVRSDPGLALTVRDRANSSGRDAEGRRGREVKSDKGKARADQRQAQPKPLKRPLSKSSKSLRATSTERWSNTRPNSTSTSALPNSATVVPVAVPIAVPVTASSSRTTKSQSRRGSDSRTAASNTEGPSSGPSSPTSLGAGERRTGLMSFLNWRPNRFPGRAMRLAPVTPVGAGATYTTHTQLQLQPGSGHVTVLENRNMRGLPTSLNARRSDEGLRRFTYDVDESISPGTVGYGSPLTGLLTAARRASSWGQGDKEEYTEMVSVRSVEQGLNEQLVGASGVFRVGPAAGGGGHAGRNGLSHDGAEGPGGVLLDVMMPDSDEEIDSDEERMRRAREPRPPRVPLVYDPREQAEDNMRFGQPAYNKTPSLDGNESEEQLSDREAERRVGAVAEQLEELPVRVHIPIHVHGNGVGPPYEQELEPANSCGQCEDHGEHHNGDVGNASDMDRDDDFYEDEDEDDDDDDEVLMVRLPSKRLD